LSDPSSTSHEELPIAGRQLPTKVAVALGSNLGDRRSHLQYAVSRLGSILQDIRVSTLYETAPVGTEGQPMFLNGAIVGRYDHTPRDLLHALMSIELERGRVRSARWAARTLDLDLVLFGNLIVNEPDLIVPHPLFRERAFVLQPLADIASELIDPVTGATVGELWERLTSRKSPANH
jgi:2-amino-4-hydroxy-6-hydroxymethyldihydropteridine diphosphokinase